MIFCQINSGTSFKTCMVTFGHITSDALFNAFITNVCPFQVPTSLGYSLEFITEMDAKVSCILSTNVVWDKVFIHK